MLHMTSVRHHCEHATMVTLALTPSELQTFSVFPSSHGACPSCTNVDELPQHFLCCTSPLCLRILEVPLEGLQVCWIVAGLCQTVYSVLVNLRILLLGVCRVWTKPGSLTSSVDLEVQTQCTSSKQRNPLGTSFLHILQQFLLVVHFQ